jgi:hypothetical protein
MSVMSRGQVSLITSLDMVEKKIPCLYLELNSSAKSMVTAVADLFHVGLHVYILLF